MSSWSTTWGIKALSGLIITFLENVLDGGYVVI
jgi:hypothetical protein